MWLGYSRVSRVGGRQETLISPDVQGKRIKAFADGRGFDLELLEPELDVSGGKVSRPILDAAIARVASGQAEGIIVAQLDRLSRMAMSDALDVLERVEGAGGSVIAVAENFDPTTPEGRLVRNIFLSMAAMQRERYGEHIGTSKRQAVERGIWPTSTVPRGYAKGRDRHLVPDPRTAPKVKRAFEMRAGGAPWSVICDHLGCTASGAAKTIRNKVYLGQVALKVGDERIVTYDAHEPIVSRELWEAAQIEHPAPPRGVNRGQALLAGVIRCAHCSRLMSPGDDIYRCMKRKASGNCVRPAIISMNTIEPYVEGLLREELQRFEVEGRTLVSTDVERQALDAAEVELEQWREAVKIADVGVEYVAGELRRLVGNVEEARKALGRAQAAGSVEHFERGAVAAYERLGVAGKRHVLRRAIGAVWVQKGRGLGRVRVIAAGFEPVNLSRPGASFPPVEVDFTDLPGDIRPVEG